MPRKKHKYLKQRSFMYVGMILQHSNNYLWVIILVRVINFQLTVYITSETYVRIMREREREGGRRWAWKQKGMWTTHETQRASVDNTPPPCRCKFYFKLMFTSDNININCGSSHYLLSLIPCIPTSFYVTRPPTLLHPQ